MQFVGERFKNNAWIEKLFVSGFLSLLEKEVYITKTVEELLFEGYQNQILSIGKTLKDWGINVGYMPERFGWYFNVNKFNI